MPPRYCGLLLLPLLHASSLPDGLGSLLPGLRPPPLALALPTPGRARENDLMNLIMDYLTPRGEGVSPECEAASNLYLAEIAMANGAALKMLDASAKLPPAGMLSNMILHHPGTFDSCLEVSSPQLTGQHCLLTSMARGNGWFGMPEHEDLGRSKLGNGSRYHLHQALASQRPLHGQLRPRTGQGAEVPSFEDMLPQLLGTGAWKLGRCVPSVCTPADVAQGMRNFMVEMLDETTMAPYDVFALNCHTAEEEIPIESSDWVMIGVIAFFGILVISGTVVDITLNILHIEEAFSDKTVQLFQGFSLYSNTLKLFHCPDPGAANSLDCINGIRFISMSWVLLGHGYSTFMGQVFVNNMNVLFGEHFMGSGAFAAVLNAMPSVDSFFLIGATLISYGTLKELDKTKGGNLKFWAMYFVHRYIRLTGLYAIVIGLHATLLKFFGTGVQSSLFTYSVTMCQDTWWTNLLYVNNLKWVSEMGLGCMGQTWYMANDMQFFLTSPFIIYALWKNRRVGLILLGSLLLIFTVIPTVLSFVNDYPFGPMPVGGGDETTYMMEFYVVPWCRYQPYLVGLGLGWLLHQLRNRDRLPLNPIAVTWIWLAAALVGCLVIYGLVPYQKEMMAGTVASTAERALYGGFHRLAWSLALSWVILACVKGAGGPANSVLSWPAWVPLARMSYCIYLVHMTVMSVVASYASYRVDISQILCIYYVIFVLAICVAISYALVMLFEAPIVHLEKLLYYSLGLSKLPAVRRLKAE